MQRFREESSDSRRESRTGEAAPVLSTDKTDLVQAKEQAQTREKALQTATELDQVLERNMEQLLSDDPAEFVIRFIQSGGQ